MLLRAAKLRGAGWLVNLAGSQQEKMHSLSKVNK